MVTIATLPSTVDGIKRLAKSIKRADGISHQAALEVAAKKAGYQNFVHAKHALSLSVEPGFSSHGRYVVYLTAYWREREGGARKAGRETLEVILSRPLSELIARHQLRRARNLGGFKIESADHLEREMDVDSHERAMSVLNLAGATLHFLDATGLIPAHTQAHYDAMRIANQLPGKDHESWWVDPQSKAWLALDEPYGNRAERERQREGWVREHGLKIAAANWSGLYNPGECKPFLLSPSEDLLARVLSQVEALELRAPASGELISDRYFTQFTSPSRLASGKPRKPRPRAAFGERMGAVPYGGAPGVPSLWRPANAMPLELHMTIGPLLHALCNSSFKASGLSMRSYNKINGVRSLLEDWAFKEHRDAITREIEEKLYYGPPVDGYASPQAALQALSDAVGALRAGYGECKPRRDLIALLEAAAKDVAGRAAKR